MDYQLVIGNYMFLYRDKWLNLKHSDREQNGAKIYDIVLERDLPEWLRSRLRSIRGVLDEN
jgi:hypothetical protein